MRDKEHPVPPGKIPERDFDHAGFEDAVRIFGSRVERAKKALSKDLEVSMKVGLPDLGPERGYNVVHVEAHRVFRRQVLWAFYEYVHATTRYASKDHEKRAEEALDDLQRRIGEAAWKDAASGLSNMRGLGAGDPDLDGFRV